MKNSQITLISGGLIFWALVFMIGCPTYHVWESGMEGKAKLNKATYDRQVRVIEARAGAEAAFYDISRDSMQGIGIAIENRIIGQSLINNEPYLHFKWLQTLEAMKGEGQVIYLNGPFPNTSSLPITEANRLKNNLVANSKDSD